MRSLFSREKNIAIDRTDASANNMGIEDAEAPSIAIVIMDNMVQVFLDGSEKN